MNYQTLVIAGKIVAKAMTEIGREDGMGYTSPAWERMWRIGQYLKSQANEHMWDGKNG